MARERDRGRGVGRREFIAGAAITGAVSTVAVCAPTLALRIASSDRRFLIHDPVRCVGCGVCSLMCSLYREGEAGPVLSRSRIVRDPFSYEFAFEVCQQCRSPQCYAACPLQDTARLRDSETGLVYVDQDECIGCGSCVDACPFDPPRTTLRPETGVALSCDRCLGRDDGPLCVAYCPMDALSCSSTEPPRRPGGRHGV